MLWWKRALHSCVGGQESWDRKREVTPKRVEEPRMKPWPSLKATRSFSPKNGIWLMEETPNWSSSPGMAEARGSFAVHCLSYKDGTMDSAINRTPVSVRIKFMSTWLGYADQLLGQTLTWVLLGRYFSDVSNICKELTFGKADYPP